MSTTPRYAGPMTDYASTYDQSSSPTRPVAVDPSLFRPEPAGPAAPPVQPASRPACHLASVAAYRTGIDHVRFWVGAGLAAAIAAMAALVGSAADRRHPALSVPVGAGTYAMIAAAIVIGASALYNLMLHVAPHPTTYYGALAAVGIALAVLLPVHRADGALQPDRVRRSEPGGRSDDRLHGADGGRCGPAVITRRADGRHLDPQVEAARPGPPPGPSPRPAPPSRRASR